MLLIRASRILNRCRRSARRALAGTGATSERRRSALGARDAAATAAGLQSEEGSREENGSGRRETGARDPNPQPRSQRSLPGVAPALVSALSCGRRRYCSLRSCSGFPITADANAPPSPTLVSPSLFSLATSSSQTASERGEGERSIRVGDD